MGFFLVSEKILVVRYLLSSIGLDTKFIPIPIIKNKEGEIQESSNLPVLLPKEVEFSGVKSPLSEMKEFIDWLLNLINL